MINYNDILGQGGFGSVYGGMYYDKDVAVKVMEVEFNEA